MAKAAAAQQRKKLDPKRVKTRQMFRIKLVLWLSESYWKKWLSKVLYSINYQWLLPGLYFALFFLCVSVAKLLLTGGSDTLPEPGATTTAVFVCQRFAGRPSRWLNKRRCWRSQVALEGGREATKAGVSNLQSGGVHHVSLFWWWGKSPRCWINQVWLYFHLEKSHSFREFWTVARKRDSKPHCLQKNLNGILNEWT